MNSTQWHRHCVAAEPAEPVPLTKAQWLRLSGAEVEHHRDQLRQWIRNLHIDSSELAGIEATLTSVVEANSESPPGAKQLVAVTGPNALGKSTLVKRWARSRYRYWIRDASVELDFLPVWAPTPDVEADLCPVVWVNLQSSARIKEFDSQFLEFFGLPGEGVTRSLTTRMIRAAERHGVKVLVVDDAHLLKTNWKGGRDVLDHVKHINTELGEQGASIVLIGANLAGGDIVIDPQIAGRLRLITLPMYGADTSADQERWQRLLLDVEDKLLPHLPAGKPGMLESELAGPLWKRTQGYIGDLARLVIEASIHANADGTHAIKPRHLAAVQLSARAHAAEEALSRPQRSNGIG
ncbi:TniB family NTP-binding protein [Rhodococcus sp. 7Tela_A2]|uniref:TniB family NTP-binding protein n=1 Tax=Rhodococcus sp. 7Tela_A2 TaxID=3093744 RepID=UPI003BB6F5BE